MFFRFSRAVGAFAFCCVLLAVFLHTSIAGDRIAAPMTMSSTSAINSVGQTTAMPAGLDLGQARSFAGFFLEGFTAQSSGVAGRLAAGGDITINHYSVGDKLLPASRGGSLIVGGDLHFPSGRVHQGDIVIGGSAAGVGTPVINGLEPHQSLIEYAELPLDFPAQFEVLTQTSQAVAQIPANGQAQWQWGGLYLEGDCQSPVQVFDLDGAQVLQAHTFEVSCLPDDATVIFNIDGLQAGLTHLSLASFSGHRSSVLFNFFQAEELRLEGVAVHGSVLAPHAHVDQPQGVLHGSIMARSWDGNMAIDHVPFRGVGGGDFCELYPIGISSEVLEGAVPGTVFSQVPRRNGSSGFSWLSWTGAPSANTLAQSLLPPGDSYTYVDPDDDSNWLPRPGQWIQSAPGNMNSSAVRNHLDSLIGVDITVPVWDELRGQGNNLDYRAASFAVVHLTDYRLTGQGWLSFEFIGSSDCAATEPPIALGQVLETDMEVPISISLQGVDPAGGELDYEIVRLPDNGTVSGQPPLVTYTPGAGFVGQDSFEFVVHSGDLSSASATVTIEVLSVEPPPSDPVIVSVPPSSLQQGEQFIYQPEVEYNGSDPLTFTLQVGPAGMTIHSASGLIEWLADSAGPQSVTWSVQNSFGAQDSQSFTVTVTSPIELGAPDSEPGVQNDLIDLEDFLYTGENPIQIGVNPEVFEPHRFAIIRGLVTDRNANPLAGVTVRILNHPEYGYTLTRENGEFDLAVNGGGELTVDYELASHLPIQRRVSVPWEDYVYAPEVTLIELDDRVTIIDLTDGTAGMQVARGSVEVDLDGPRQATVLFPAGTAATITTPSGDTVSLDQISFRATEYTVGGRGPQMMPGDLPPSIAYTYAVELSVDEALAAGATSVGFDRRVPLYVENFLEFPVGTGVPVGYYDRERGAWVGYDNGAVIEILDVVDGMAVLDVTGEGPATAELLSALHVTDAERARLADIYQVGQSLQRVALDHFSPWDLNFPVDRDEDEEDPPDVEDDPGKDTPDDEKDDCDGCIINPQDRNLAKEIPVTGTPFELRYDSRRQHGYESNSRIRIPLTGPAVHAEVIRVEATVTVAGKRESRVFSNAPNQVWEFEWDGRDIRGRRLERATATVSVTHVYPQWYRVPPGWQANRLWGVPPIGIEVNERNRFAFGETSTNRRWQIQLGRDLIVESAALGGWTIDQHHASLQIRHRGRLTTKLQRGDGKSLIVGGAGDSIETIAGPDTGLGSPHSIAVEPDGSILVAGGFSHQVYRINPDQTVEVIAGTGVPGYSGDGGAAIAAQLHKPTGVGHGPDGSIYIAEEEGNRVRKISTDGIIRTIAGTGDAGFSGDGGPAEHALLNGPYALAVDGESSVFVVDWRNNRVRRIGTDGTIQTIVGNGGWGSEGEGLPALEISLNSPGGVTLGRDGSLYIADWGNHRVRKVTPDGLIWTVAGTGVDGGIVDGLLAVETTLAFPDSVAVDDFGNLYIADWGNNAIRRVDMDGIITTVAGTGSYGYEGDGDLATNAILGGAIGVDIAPDGSTLIGDTGNDRVRRVASTISAGTEFHAALPSRDASLVYLFDEYGRHRQTRNTITDGLLQAFTYDDENRLISITDGDNNITSIVRNDNGVPTEIISPDGHRTQLSTDANGYLSTITDPAGVIWQIQHDDNGLLTSFTNRRGAMESFYYDSSGELMADVNPEGGGWSLDRLVSDRVSETRMETTEGRIYDFHIELEPGGLRWHTTTGPDGLDTVRMRDPARGLTFSQRPNGLETTLKEVADPRFGIASRFPERQVTRLPSGLQRETISARQTVLADPDNPFSLVELSERFSVNGRQTEMVYNAEESQWLVHTPEGREFTVRTDEMGRPIESSSPELAPIRNIYDSRGRLSAMNWGDDGDTRTFDFAYHTDGHQAGYLESITDPLSRTTRFEYDASGRLTRQVRPGSHSVEFTYDAEGNARSLTTPNGDVHLFEYNLVDDRNLYEPPELGGEEAITVYRYNRDRQMVGIDRPGGETVAFDYDFAGRLDSVTSNVGTVDYSYHPETGQLSTISAPDGITLSYTWDGFLPDSETSSGAVVGTVLWEFDNNFWMIEESVAGQAATFAYDDDGLLTNAGLLSLTRHPIHGLLTGTEMTGITGSRSYNFFGELSSRAVTVNSLPVYQASYHRDPLGRIDRQELTIDGFSETWDYHYDDAGRLEVVERNGGTEHVYVYDDNGNRTAHTGPGGAVTLAEYDDQDRLILYGDIVYTHAEAGERLTRTDANGITTYTYDAHTNLRGVSLPDGTQIEYLIDGRHRRVGKKVDGVLQMTWIYRDQLSPVAQFDGNGNLTHRFVYAEQAHSPSYMVKIDSITAQETVYRLITDHLGSIRLVVDVETGAVAQRIDYGPFGEVLLDSSPGFQPFGFAGGLYDVDTGLVRFGARDYDPEVGRWAAKDPIGFGGGDTNLFGYVWVDPVNFIDPIGESAWAIAREGAKAGGNIGARIGMLGGPKGAAVGGVLGALTGVGLSYWMFNKAPENANNPDGPKAPGKPGADEGFEDPRGGENWVPNPNPGRGGSSHGWEDRRGRVWCPTGQGGRAHGGPHWDVQLPNGDHVNVPPGTNIADRL